MHCCPSSALSFVCSRVALEYFYTVVPPVFPPVLSCGACSNTFALLQLTGVSASEMVRCLVAKTFKLNYTGGWVSRWVGRWEPKVKSVAGGEAAAEVSPPA